MTLMRLFAAYARKQRQCFCGAPQIHRGCLNAAFDRFLDELERAVRAGGCSASGFDLGTRTRASQMYPYR